MYMLGKCGAKIKCHFKWVRWQYKTFRQLNLELNRPNGLVGCKVLLDIINISVKEPMQMNHNTKIEI